jgi:prophage tail gpP-like protein
MNLNFLITNVIEENCHRSTEAQKGDGKNRKLKEKIKKPLPKRKRPKIIRLQIPPWGLGGS